ncbi:MAG: hypothetical protein AAGF50_14100, partial [Pseudomonadota bacterium]
RSMLVPTAREGHELACASCGAPIHELKWLKSPSPKAKKSKASPSNGGYRQNKHDRRSYTRRKKKRKPTWKKALEEAFDLVEDIFD